MSNERKTEQLTRKIFKNLGYYDDNNIMVEEQISDNPIIQKLLKSASKKGSGMGKPEFIVQFLSTDILVVVECKAKISNHKSTSLDKFAEYAVDGAVLYGKYLSKEFHVISVGVSGESEETLRISNYLWIKESFSPIELKVEKICSKQEYLSIIKGTNEKKEYDIKNIKKNTKAIHKMLRETIKITDELKPIIISAILLALSEKSFADSYSTATTPKSLLNFMLTSIRNKLESIESMPEEKVKIMMRNFQGLESINKLSSNKKEDKDFLNIIEKVKTEIWPFINTEHSFDYIGEFYKEFLSYTDGNKKGLGIVLTPNHITDLFCELANIGINDRIIDPCCGTGGFLISAMNSMLSKTDDPQIQRRIRRDQLIGIESESKMFTLAAANMIIRGDGKSNLYNASCFDKEIYSKVKTIHKPTVAFMNPPYSQTDDGGSELDFVLNMLNLLEPGGLGLAIIPINCVCSLMDKEIEKREKILEKHTLLGVMSMPTTLFYPVGTVTAIVIFEAHRPHDSKIKSWFGYCRDDGFIVSRNSGRIDRNKKWEEKKSLWVNSFRNRETIKDFSILRAVTAKDEWCAEAYLQPDYSQISEQKFQRAVEEYFVFKALYTSRFEEIGEENAEA